MWVGREYPLERARKRCHIHRCEHKTSEFGTLTKAWQIGGLWRVGRRARPGSRTRSENDVAPIKTVSISWQLKDTQRAPQSSNS